MVKCVCKKLPNKFLDLFGNLVKKENRSNDLFLGGSIRNLWKPNKNLKVAFQLFDSDPKIIDEILKVANIWSKYCSISFIYEKQYKHSDVLVSLQKNIGFYSAIGLHSKIFAMRNKPSMNLDPKLGIISGFSRKKDFRNKYCKYLVIHEFGHALGLVHEHQRFDRPFNFNRRYIKENFLKLGMPNFKIAKENILNVYRDENIIKSIFDFKSIMMYGFKKEAIMEKLPIKIPLFLSVIDKDKINKIYPKN